METAIDEKIWDRFFLPFNFLASLINGNARYSITPCSTAKTFNFLASLINGNFFFEIRFEFLFFSFNFLASLINGNPQHICRSLGSARVF